MPDRILIVDDDPDALYLYTHASKKYGLEVDTATNFSDAQRKLRRLLPQYVVTDIHLEQNHDNKDGYKIAREAKELGIKHVVIYSGTESPSQDISGVQVIEKPDLICWLEENVKK